MVIFDYKEGWEIDDVDFQFIVFILYMNLQLYIDYFI